jgi:hypothetical protein
MSVRQYAWGRVSADGTKVEKRRRLSNPPSLIKRSGQPYWLPMVIDKTKTATGTETVTETIVEEEIQNDRIYTQINTRDMTVGEINQKDINTLKPLTRTGDIDRAQFQAILNHENRIRALERGELPPVPPPASNVTVGQFVDWIKARLR